MMSLKPIVFIVLLLGGCDYLRAGLDSGEGSAPHACTSDAQCLATERCVVDLGACVLREYEPETIAATLTPSAATRYAATQFPEVELSSSRTTDFVLPAARRVAGWVRIADNPLEYSVSATIMARAEGDIAGTEYLFSTTSRKKAKSDSIRGFELLLAPTRHPYDITVLLENEAFPPYHLAPTTFDRDVTDLVIQVPALESYYRLSGRLVNTLATGTPLTEVRLAAFSHSTPNTSTTAEVAEDGRFVVLVPSEPKSDLYRLVLQPHGSTAAIPSLTLIEEFTVGESIDLGDLELPRLPGKGEVQIRATCPEGGAAAGVEIRCRGDIAGGVLTSTGKTDAQGQATLTLRRGEYSCVFMPPTGDWLGVTQAEFELATIPAPDEPHEWEIALARKSKLQGTLHAHGSGAPVAHVTVAAVNLEHGHPLRGREVSTTSDLNGDYSLMLEDGRYLLIASPNMGVGQAMGLIDDLSLVGDTVLDIDFPPARVVSGVVSGSDDEPIPGVRVDFFRNTPEIYLDPAPEDSESDSDPKPARARLLDSTLERTVRVIGSAVSDENGHYKVLLPANL